MSQPNAPTRPNTTPYQWTAYRDVKTLGELLKEDEAGKRKRVATHFEGIPISMIRSSTPLSVPGGRKIVTSKKLERLGCAMSRMGVSANTSVTSDSNASGATDDSDDEDECKVVIVMDRPA